MAYSAELRHRLTAAHVSQKAGRPQEEISQTSYAQSNIIGGFIVPLVYVPTIPPI